MASLRGGRSGSRGGAPGTHVWPATNMMQIIAAGIAEGPEQVAIVGCLEHPRDVEVLPWVATEIENAVRDASRMVRPWTATVGRYPEHQP